MIEISEVRGSLTDFIIFPSELFSSDANFVPQLEREMRHHFSPRNPFFRHAEAKFFLAKKDGKTAGRIIAFVNRRHNEFHNEKTGFFGFFDSINDPAVAEALFGTTAAFLRSEGMEVMRGPMNFSTNEECGFLLEGFDEPPILMMPYNHPYYNDLCTGNGFRKVKDLYAYIYQVADELPEKVTRVAEIAEKRGVRVRPIEMKKFVAEMMIFKDVYHSAWEENWGFIPMTDEELVYTAERLKQIVVPELTLIAEKDGEPIGFMGLVPDFNFVLQKMRGKLNPISIAKALYYSKKVRDLRLMLLGIKKEYRNKGVEALLFRNGFGPVRRGNYKRVEFSWILEDNFAVQGLVEVFGGRLYKKYRIYEKPL